MLYELQYQGHNNLYINEGFSFHYYAYIRRTRFKGSRKHNYFKYRGFHHDKHGFIKSVENIILTNNICTDHCMMNGRCVVMQDTEQIVRPYDKMGHDMEVTHAVIPGTSV